MAAVNPAEEKYGYYKLVGVDVKATAEEVQRAYKRRALVLTSFTNLHFHNFDNLIAVWPGSWPLSPRAIRPPTTGPRSLLLLRALVD